MFKVSLKIRGGLAAVTIAGVSVVFANKQGGYVIIGYCVGGIIRAFGKIGYSKHWKRNEYSMDYRESKRGTFCANAKFDFSYIERYYATFKTDYSAIEPASKEFTRIEKPSLFNTSLVKTIVNEITRKMVSKMVG